MKPALSDLEFLGVTKKKYLQTSHAYLSNNGKLEPRPSASLSLYLVLAETNDRLTDELAIWLAPNTGSSLSIDSELFRL